MLCSAPRPGRGRRRPRRSRPRRASGSGSRPRPRRPSLVDELPGKPLASSIRSSWKRTGPSQSIPSHSSERWICSVASSTSRLVSVFSIRRSTSPPFGRANSQLKRKVRTLPMWRSPVGPEPCGLGQAGSRHYRRRVPSAAMSAAVKAAPERAGNRRRRAPALRAEPARVALPEPRPGGARVLLEERARAAGMEADRPCDLPLQPREAPTRRSTASRSRPFGRRWTRPAPSAPTAWSSTSDRISAPDSRPAWIGLHRRSSRS